MTAPHDPFVSADPEGLLDRAIGFTLGAVHAVTPDRLAAPTPCPKWDLRSLLLHVADSLDALCEGFGTGQMDLHGPSASQYEHERERAAANTTAVPGPLPPVAVASAGVDDPVALLRSQAVRLRGVWAARTEWRHPVRIADSPLDPRIVLGVGAVEIAVHGWDINRACGSRQPIPPALALELVGICALVVTDDTRHPAFAEPVAVPGPACPSDHLVAFLGRDPESTYDYP